MNINNPISNCRTFTLKDRQVVQIGPTYQDIRAYEFAYARANNLPLPTEEYILNQCTKHKVMLETVQSKRNIVSPTNKMNSSQRMDLHQGQSDSTVAPINADFPVIDSCMRHDMLTRSSCIRRATGKIKLIARVSYQLRTIYVYELNGMFYYMDNKSGMIESNGFGCKFKTDLDDIPVGEYVDISQDSFLLRYPDQYNPNTDTVAIGQNIRTICATNWDNSGDSTLVSESFLNKFATFKLKNINLQLVNKSIKSKYPGKFPKVGEFVDDIILFKVCNDVGVVSELSQSPNTATGVEDDTIVLDRNSFLTSIEVYCNNPIADPDLEKLRCETLDFRHRVYNAIAPLVENFYDKCSYDLRVLYGNYAHDLFNAGFQEIKYPLIQIKAVTIDIPPVGAKFSNNLGSKVTVQRVYPDGWFKDELGRNIEMIFPSTAIINRTVAGVPWEIYLSSFVDLLKYKVDNDLITPE